MNVCYFGSYAPDYSRNRNIRKGLQRNGIGVIECNASGIVFLRYFKLFKRFLQLKDSISSLLVGFPGHYDIFLASFLGKLFRKKVVYDVYVSLYETYVLDRKIVKRKSGRARFYYLIDWLGLKLADLVLVDTNAHFRMYFNLYKLKQDKTLTIYIGSDGDFFYPTKINEDIDVLYQGTYQPLNGTEYIIKAAQLLPKVIFFLIGRGQDRSKAERLAKKMNLKNVTFIDWVNYRKLSRYINRSKVLLGSIGKGDKANAIISNKLYDAFACKKAVINGKTYAGSEILSHKENCFIVKNADPKDLAGAIKILLLNENLRKKIAFGGYRDFKRYYSPKPMVRNLVQYLTTN